MSARRVRRHIIMDSIWKIRTVRDRESIVYDSLHYKGRKLGEGVAV